MPRYIDADLAINDLCGSQCGCTINECGLEEPCEKARCILKQPTADVQEIKHGRWIRGVSKGWPKKPSCLWYCSCCGEKIRYIDTLRTYQKSKKPVNEVNPRCRKCGAKMDKKEDKNENNKDQD